MKKHSIIAKVLLLVLVLNLFLSGCDQMATKTPASSMTDTEEHTLVWCMNKDDMLTMDPAYIEDPAHYQCLFEGLCREERGGVIVPAAAESWDVSEDGKTIVFHIRKDATWSNGDPVTAEDFVYSWKRILNPETGAPYGWIFEFANIVGAVDAMYNGASLDNVGLKAIDEKTLEVKLTAPTQWFPGLTAFYTFMPVNKKAVESGEDWSNNPDKFVGNAGFTIAEYKVNDYEVLLKREDYWDADNIFMDNITVKYISDPNTAVAAFKNGEIDVREGIPATAAAELRTQPNSGLVPMTNAGCQFVDLNMSRAPFDDIRVRLAFAYAIDRIQLTDTIGSGVPPVTHVIPAVLYDDKGNEFTSTAEKTFEYPMPLDGSKIEEAKALLAEAGYPNGEGFPTVKLLCNSSDASKMPEILQEMWKQNLGVNVELDPQEEKMFRENRVARNCDMCMASWLIDYTDPSSTLSIFTSENRNNYCAYMNPEYDALVDTAMNTQGEEHYKAMYDAYKMLMDSVPHVPLVAGFTNYVMKPNLDGWVWRAAGMDMSRAYWK